MNRTYLYGAVALTAFLLIAAPAHAAYNFSKVSSYGNGKVYTTTAYPIYTMSDSINFSENADKSITVATQNVIMKGGSIITNTTSYQSYQLSSSNYSDFPGSTDQRTGTYTSAAWNDSTQLCNQTIAASGVTDSGEAYCVFGKVDQYGKTVLAANWWDSSGYGGGAVLPYRAIGRTISVYQGKVYTGPLSTFASEWNSYMARWNAHFSSCSFIGWTNDMTCTTAEPAPYTSTTYIGAGNSAAAGYNPDTCYAENLHPNYTTGASSELTPTNANTPICDVFQQTGPLPAPAATLTATPSTITSGSSANLTYSCSNGATSATIDNGVGTVSPASAGSRSVTPGATTTYKLTCTNTAGSSNATATVTVSPAIIASCTVTPGSISAGQAATWSVSTTEGPGSYTYSWTGTDGLTGSTASVGKTYPASGTKQASVTISAAAQASAMESSDLARSNRKNASFMKRAIAFILHPAPALAAGCGGLPMFGCDTGGRVLNDTLEGSGGDASSVNGGGGTGGWDTSIQTNVSPTVATVTCPTLTVTDLSPDLTSGGVSASGLVAGQATTLSATDTNIGNGSSGAFPTLFQIADSAISYTIAMRESSYISLAASETASVSAAYTFASAGTYQVRACANNNSSWTNITSESNYGNNCGPWTAVTVAAPPAPTCSLSMAAPTVPTTIRWSSTGATSCTGGGFSTGGATSGSTAVSDAGVYQLGCTGAGGTCTMAVSAAASTCAGPAAVSISANPMRVKAGQASTIAWNASNVPGASPSCTISGPGVSQTVSAEAAPTCAIPAGSATPTILTQSTYTITCGGVSQSVTVNVVPKFEEF